MNILCLSTSNYYPFPTRKQNVMNRLTDCNIIYVDPPVSLIAPLKDKKAKEYINKYKQAPVQAKDHIKVYAQPPVLPFFNKKRKINRVNQKRLARYLAKIVKENGFGKDFWVWCYSPTSADAITPLAIEMGIEPRELWSRTVYDCVDRHSAYPGMIDPMVVDHMEQDLVIGCGRVFATAQGLYDRLKGFNRRTYLIPNGAAYELFSKTAEMEKEGIYPHFGFVGMLQECTDYELIEHLAKNFPNGKISLVGRKLPGVDISWMDAYDNIDVVGLVPQDTLPGIIKNFDVCLNLFKDNELSKDVSPLKFYEYLATGKPVVSTPVPYQVRDYADCIYIAENKEEFIRKCMEALAEKPDDPRRAKRMAAARACSWDERVKSMKELLGW